MHLKWPWLLCFFAKMLQKQFKSSYFRSMFHCDMQCPWRTRPYLFDAEINCLRKLLSFCYILCYTPRLHENGLFQILKREKALDRKQGIDCNKSDCPPSETPICQRTQNKIPYRITSTRAKRRITRSFKSIFRKVVSINEYY